MIAAADADPPLSFGTTVAFASMGTLASLWLYFLLSRLLRPRLPPAADPPRAAAPLGVIALAVYLGLSMVLPLALADTESSLHQNVAAAELTLLGAISAAWSLGRGRFLLAAEDLGLAWPPRPRVAFAAAVLMLAAILPAFVGASAFNAWLVQASGLDAHQALVRSLLDDATLRGNPLLLAQVVIVGPILEELFFRGFLQRALASVFGAAGGIAFGALLFAAVHDAPARVPVFVVGLALGAIAARTGSIWPAALAHCIFNGAQIAWIVYAAAPT